LGKQNWDFLTLPMVKRRKTTQDTPVSALTSSSSQPGSTAQVRAQLIGTVRPLLAREAQTFRQTANEHFRSAGELRRELSERFASWSHILRTLRTSHPESDWGEGDSICSELKEEIVFLLAMACGRGVRHEWRAPGWLARWPMEMDNDRVPMPAASLGFLDEADSRFVLAAITRFFGEPSRVYGAENSTPPTGEKSVFRHDGDFAWVVWKGHRYKLGPTARKAMRILYNAYDRHEPEVSGTALMKEIGTPSSRVRDVFKRTGLWKTLVVSTSPGVYRLNLPDPSVAKAQ
jgi:hypothetical protein